MWPFSESRFDRVVAIEHDEQRDQFVQYKRNSREVIEEISISSKHFFIVDAMDLCPRGSNYLVVDLAGELPLRYLVLCDSYRDYLYALREAKRYGRVKYGEAMSDHIWQRSPVEAFLMRSGTTLFTNLHPDDLKVVALDFEMYTNAGKHFATSADPNDKIILASLADNRGHTYLLDERALGEAGLIKEVCRLICENDYDVICGHNLVGFDLPYLAARAQQLNVPLCLGRNGSILQERANRRRLTLRESPDFFVFGRHIIDTLPLLLSWDITKRELENYRLKDAVNALGISARDRRDFDRGDISQMWDANSKALLDYAEADAIDSLALYNFLSPSLFYQTQMLPLTYQQCAATGTGTKADLSLIRAYLQKTHSLPLRGAHVFGEGRGGLTEARSLGWHNDIHKADVASLYPSICLSYNIKPRTDVLGAFPAVLKVLTERRLAAKASLKNLPPDGYEFKATDALQNSLKILINSFYGMLGTSGLYFSDSESSNNITTKGQEILLKMVHNVERAQGKVIEIDTDGIYFTLPKCTKAATDISRLVAVELPPGIRVDYDGHYDYMYSYAPKNYLLVQKDMLIRKGVVFRSRRLFGLQNEFITMCTDYLVKGDIGGLASYYRQTAQRIRNREVELESVTTYLSVDRTITEYEESLKGQGQHSRPLDLIISRPDRDKWTLRSKIHYYHAGNGSIKLVEDYAQDIDSTYYLELLRKSAERFLYVFPPQDWYRIFSETPLSDEDASRIRTWSFEPRQTPDILSEYERVVKGDFQLRLF